MSHSSEKFELRNFDTVYIFEGPPLLWAEMMHGTDSTVDNFEVILVSDISILPMQFFVGEQIALAKVS